QRESGQPLAEESRGRGYVYKIIVRLGSHDMFIADVVNVLADDRLIDAGTGAFDLGAAGLLNYSHGHYFEQGTEIGHFGWSVKKK
ncbi:MAG: flavin reductase family protein, partial [Duncaniella sp.]|nr:flavin reductase family protein [Duncaniella sp.]